MKKLWIGLFAAALAVVAFLVYRIQGMGPVPIVVQMPAGPAQPKVSPEEAGIDAEAIQLAVDYAADRNTSALVIGRGGHIVFEKYWDATNFDSPVSRLRAESALTALLVGSAMNDRVILSLDLPLSNYVTEYAGKAEGAVTLRALLAGQGVEGTDKSSFELLAIALEHVTKQPYQAIVAERLWGPLEAGDFTFSVAQANCCMTARLGDWMRVGEVLANDGVFEGNQFTPPRYVTLMLTPTHKDSPVGFGVHVDGAFAAKDVAWIDGPGKQRMWVVPSLKLVILRLGDDPPESRGWDEAMIPDSIIRGTSGWQPSSVHEGVDPNKFAPH